LDQSSFPGWPCWLLLLECPFRLLPSSFKPLSGSLGLVLGLHFDLEDRSKWFLIKNYRYKNMTFKNYLFFVANFCFENDSSNCIKLINGFIKKLGLCKNLHKKNIIKYIR
jgi:hypothetical protein